MNTRGYAATHIGKSRSNNEDSYLINEEIGLYVVCDGMGGHDAGEVASLEAATALNRFLTNHIVDIDGMCVDDDLKGIQDLVIQAVQYASKHVHAYGEAAGHRDMGTTLTMLLAVDDRAVVASVGDSRAYHCREGFVKLLTSDHTLAYEMMMDGQISTAELRNHPFGHLLTRRVGLPDDIEVDTVVAHLVRGDVFVLCTDGLSTYLECDAELGHFVFGKPSNVPEDLVTLANLRGGKDNITAVAIQVSDGGQLLPTTVQRNWLTRIA